MQSATKTLLEEVESFLTEHNLSATRFGVLAAGDTKFVRTLRAGRSVRDGTAERIRRYMAENRGN